MVINSTTVEVTWDPPSITNGILRYYTVVYGSSDGMEMMEVNSTDVASSRIGEDVGSGFNVGSISLLVSGLDPFTNYTFYVLAVTVAPSEPSDSVTVRTDEGGKKYLAMSKYISCIYFRMTVQANRYPKALCTMTLYYAQTEVFFKIYNARQYGIFSPSIWY